MKRRGRAIRRRYGQARRPKATPAESLRNFATLVEHLLVRDHGFSKGEAQASVDIFGSLIAQEHDSGGFPSSVAIRIAKFQNEESVIHRKGHARAHVQTFAAYPTDRNKTREVTSVTRHATAPGVYPDLFAEIEREKRRQR